MRRHRVEELDSFTPADPLDRAHLDFVRDHDALVRRFGERSYLIPDLCNACGRLIDELQRTQTQTQTGDPR